jgi:hypothetical protein
MEMTEGDRGRPFQTMSSKHKSEQHQGNLSQVWYRAKATFPADVWVLSPNLCGAIPYSRFVAIVALFHAGPVKSTRNMHKKNEGTALLLGVVFAKEQRAKRGQEYRDRVRCEAMENLGYDVRTLDNKHSDSGLDKHCNANFSDTRRMMKSMDAKWNGEKFDHVILDYFFSPVCLPLLTTMYTFDTMQLHAYRLDGLGRGGRIHCSRRLSQR